MVMLEGSGCSDTRHSLPSCRITSSDWTYNVSIKQHSLRFDQQTELYFQSMSLQPLRCEPVPEHAVRTSC